MHRLYSIAGLGITAATLNVGCTGAKAGAPANAGANAAQVSSAAAEDVGRPAWQAEPKPSPAMPGKNVSAIKVDTVGYPAKWRKIVVFNVSPEGATVQDAKGKDVLTIAPGDIVERGVDPASKDPVWQVDISKLTTPGEYVVVVGEHRSESFRVADDVYANALTAGLKHFYFQRCRTALKAPHAEWEGDAYLRETACHAHEDIGWDLNDYPEKKRKWAVEGGWHDAGNFEMYVPVTAPTAQALLMAYEVRPEIFDDSALNVPESGNKVPDILDEAKWGLDWVLTMQDESGGFRHSEALRKWSAQGPADKELTPRWIAGVGTAATAKAVAVLAVASRVYKKWDPKFAARCAAASHAGWKWLEAHPERVMVDGKGSEQPLWDDGPDVDSVAGARLIAAAEVWRAFRTPSALTSAKALMKEKDTTAARLHKGAWGNLSRWGLMTLAADPETPAAIRTEARNRILEAAEDLKEQIDSKDGYRCATDLEGYYWGHNSNLLEKAHLLLAAHRLDPKRQWLAEAARDQWHWILGRNPNGFSMVTRLGKGPERIYHMEWGRADRPVPGYLVGGPNSQQMDMLAPGAPAKALLWENPIALRSGIPAGSLWHAEQSDLWDGAFIPEGNWENGWWAITEPDIYYNANLVLVATEMQP